MNPVIAEPVTVLVSMLSQYAYCPRRCALMFVEQTYEDNEYTLRGQAVHENVDEPGWIQREGQRIERALLVWHDELGLQGKCDVVVFRTTARLIQWSTNRAGAATNAPTTSNCARKPCASRRCSANRYPKARFTTTARASDAT